MGKCTLKFCMYFRKPVKATFVGESMLALWGNAMCFSIGIALFACNVVYCSMLNCVLFKLGKNARCRWSGGPP
jgi:hypothetical protein